MPRKKKLTAQLPPTPCTPALRKAVEDEANRREVSMSDLTREALSLFLGLNDSISVRADRLSEKANQS